MFSIESHMFIKPTRIKIFLYKMIFFSIVENNKKQKPNKNEKWHTLQL